MNASEDQQRLLESADEVLIETAEDGRSHSTVIWVVVVDGDVFVRSYLGERGRWYQRVLRSGQAALRVDGTRIPFRAEPEPDPSVNQRIDEAYRRKYGARWPRETAAMVEPDAVRTSLRLRPDT